MSNPDFMVISIDPAGAASAMHRDDFPLGFLGKQKIARASEIKFNDSSQLWDIYAPYRDGDPVEDWHTFYYIREFKTYDSARRFEVLWMEHCALQSIAPLSTEGKQLAERLRMTYDDIPPRMFPLVVK